MMAVSVLVQVFDWQAGIITLLVFFTLFFSIGVAVTCMLLRQIIRPINDGKVVDDKSAVTMKVEPAFVNEAFSTDASDDILPENPLPNDMKV